MPSAFEYPEADPLADSALLAVPLDLLPFLLGAVGDLRARAYWQTRDDWIRASEAISGFLECSMTACLGDLLASNDRLYRLLDTGLNGTVYAAGGDPLIIVPDIPDVPPLVAVLPGMIARLDHVEVMLDELPGILDPGWFGYGGSKATLADVVRSLRIGNNLAGDDLGETFQNILGSAGDIGSIGETIVDLLGTGVSTVAEGGIMAVLAAGIVGQLAAAGAISSQLLVMATQLTRVIAALDGGGFGPPDDNILLALRGTTAASDTRNVIDSIVGALALITSDDPAVLAKLEEIRVLLA